MKITYSIKSISSSSSSSSPKQCFKNYLFHGVPNNLEIFPSTKFLMIHTKSNCKQPKCPFYGSMKTKFLLKLLRLN